MKKQLLLMMLVVAVLTACNNAQEKAPEGDSTAALPESKGGEFFGEAFTTANPVTLDELIAQMSGADSLAVQVAGTVSEVCQMKGCWMNIQPDNADYDAVMVRFKDYGFFMPKDIAGRRVLMNGYAFKELTPVDELRHYAEDAGKSAEEIAAITEPKAEIKFLASGVFLIAE